MAACPTSGCDGVDASTLDWFKISEKTNDGSIDNWASDTIVSTLKWSFDIPSDLAPGGYLVRHEIIAMHSTGAPQVYPYCFQANLIGSGSAVPTDTTTFPAAYNLNDDFKTWNLYNGQSPSEFVAPGPAVYGGGSGGGSNPPTPAPSTSEATPEPSSSAAPVPSSSAVSSPVPSPTDGGEGEESPSPIPSTSTSTVVVSTTSAATL